MSTQRFFAVWNLQLKNLKPTLEKSNPMYNMHPKVKDNIVEKKCVLCPRFYGSVC